MKYLFEEVELCTTESDFDMDKQEQKKLYDFLINKPRAFLNIFHKKIDIQAGAYEVVYSYLYNNYQALPLMKNFSTTGFDILGFVKKLPDFEIVEFTDSQSDGFSALLKISSCGSLIYFHRSVMVACHQFDAFNKLTDLANEFFVEKSKNEIDIHIVNQSNGGLYLNKSTITIPEIDIEYNYGQEFFAKHHSRITSALHNKHTGCYIFSGPPGTGKTFYIQHLASISNKKFIYLPESLISTGLDSPSVISLLSENRESVLIIEDGEKFIMSRKDEPNSLVSTILNISEGFLAAVIKCSVIITHNQLIDVNSIDPALMRKGRLNYTYTFDKLNVEDANRKLEQLGLTYRTKEPMSLGDIFNLNDETNFAKTEKRMGF
jgi:ATPase family associated with various cellular activities (AAA)